MQKDPIVEEVRLARQSHSRRFNDDLNAIVQDLQRKQSHMNRPVVSLPPKRILQKAS
jgi:hypothetical protein